MPRLLPIGSNSQATNRNASRHIAVQLLQFSLAIEGERRRVKKVLEEALQNQPDVETACQTYAEKNGFRNVDRLLEYLVFESPFSVLVIIDNAYDIETVLSNRFQFGIDVLELSRYESDAGERVYHFEPFLEEVVGESETATDRVRPPVVSADEIDTIVVPAYPESVEETFLGENRWYAVRISGAVRPQIKYIAVYQRIPSKQ